MLRSLGLGILCAVALAIGLSFGSRVLNSGVVRELRAEPDGDRARKVMLLTLPSGKSIPVNYLRDGPVVYAGADFPWWRELRGDGGAVTVLIRGVSYKGHGRAVRDEPNRRAEVFARLRPTAPRWTGTLVEVVLEAPAGADTESSGPRTTSP